MIVEAAAEQLVEPGRSELGRVLGLQDGSVEGHWLQSYRLQKLQ